MKEKTMNLISDTIIFITASTLLLADLILIIPKIWEYLYPLQIQLMETNSITTALLFVFVGFLFAMAMSGIMVCFSGILFAILHARNCINGTITFQTSKKQLKGSN